MKIFCAVSLGELIDKITILEIKLDKISEHNSKENIKKELNSLTNTFENLKFDIAVLQNLKLELKKTNLELWIVEDKLRIHEKENNFNEEFINLARSVYKLNDYRFKIKNDINKSNNSDIIEVKSYQKYS